MLDRQAQVQPVRRFKAKTYFTLHLVCGENLVVQLHGGLGQSSSARSKDIERHFPRGNATCYR